MMQKNQIDHRLRFLTTLCSALVTIGISVPFQSALASPADNTSIQMLPPLDTTIAGERLEYPSTAKPEISTEILTIQPHTTTQWMTHPVPAYLYVLEGTLTVEFQDGTRKQFAPGDAFLQSRTKWHRGRDDTSEPVKFLAVFVGSKGVPVILHPPTAQ